MKFFTAAALFAGVAVAHYSEAITTTVTEYTTFCPVATTVTHGSETIVVTEPTTLTLACPHGCTVTQPIYSTSKVICPTVSASPIASIVESSAPYKNGTTTIPVTVPAPTGTLPATTTPFAPIASGGAERIMGASGAGLAAALGFAAFFL